MENSAQTFDTQVLSRVSTLKMIAINLVEGLLTGQHRSRHKGASVEFAEYKDYSPAMRSAISTGRSPAKPINIMSNNMNSLPT